MKCRCLGSVFSLCLLGFIIGQGMAPALAQQSQGNESDRISIPKLEDFLPANDLLAPWRSSKCALKGSEILNHLCVDYVGDEYVSASVVTLFNGDGTIWHRLELANSPGNYRRAGITDFVPFSTGYNKSSDMVILRVVGESANWYQVEVNENTRETRYVRKDDKSWSRTKWDGWLFVSVNLVLADNQEPFRDRPDGKIIAASESIKFERVKFLKADGDWAFVEGISNPRMPNPQFHTGWIRWRKGRQILVGCIFNRYVAP